jgi:hypothetical protein
VLGLGEPADLQQGFPGLHHLPRPVLAETIRLPAGTGSPSTPSSRPRKSRSLTAHRARPG